MKAIFYFHHPFLPNKMLAPSKVPWENTEYTIAALPLKRSSICNVYVTPTVSLQTCVKFARVPILNLIPNAFPRLCAFLITYHIDNLNRFVVNLFSVKSSGGGGG
jgi:hypothetical protein